MDVALADAIAEGQSRVWWCRSQCVLWGSVWCGQWGLVLNFFTYLLVVIWSFTLDGSENVPRRTTWVSRLRRTPARVRGNSHKHHIPANVPRRARSRVRSFTRDARTHARLPACPRPPDARFATSSWSSPLTLRKCRGETHRDARAWRHAEWPRLNLVQQARVSSLTRDGLPRALANPDLASLSRLWSYLLCKQRTAFRR